MKLLPAALLGMLACLNPALAAEAPAPTGAAPAATATVPDAADAASAATDDAPPLPVYMVTRIKLTGTDFTQVVFFRHHAITTMEACEAERQAGLSTGWNHFSRYYLKTLKGISYKVEYRCVESKQDFAFWRQGVPLDNFYLVRTKDGQLEVLPQRNFFACRDALQAGGAAETVDAFCAISSQAIVQKPAEPAIPAAASQ
ncbi:MAG: hypothetical protein K0S46_2568 [Moraxellaceae bacterium]|nr:hypothetical protein [Moraxellaceae bacterium]